MQRSYLPLFLTVRILYDILIYEKIWKKKQKKTAGFLKQFFLLQLLKNTWKEAAKVKYINWLNTNDRFSQYVLSTIDIFFNNVNLKYFNEVCFPAEPCKINVRSSFWVLRQPLKKSRKGLNSASYSVPFLWKKFQLEIKGEKA